jgi:hypothetical protein
VLALVPEKVSVPEPALTRPPEPVTILPPASENVRFAGVQIMPTPLPDGFIFAVQPTLPVSARTLPLFTVVTFAEELVMPPLEARIRELMVTVVPDTALVSLTLVSVVRLDEYSVV